MNKLTKHRINRMRSPTARAATARVMKAAARLVDAKAREMQAAEPGLTYDAAHAMVLLGCEKRAGDGLSEQERWDSAFYGGKRWGGFDPVGASPWEEY